MLATVTQFVRAPVLAVPACCRSEAEELRYAKLHLEQQLGRRVVGMLGHSKGATGTALCHIAL